ncbi:MAG: (d)CMP kinase [Magnetococcales bacterium]|nr:(d)CMP kinase [Magnetococcales bacterium]
MSRLVIAVDGPAGAGKGSVCRAVAHHFGFDYLDTGTLYRAVALLMLERNWPEEESLLAEAASHLDFRFESRNADEFRAFLEGRDVSDNLREERVGEAASRVAAMPAVRQALLTFQRHYGGERDLILDGRDVGTVVFPEAPLKVFLTASLEARAERRALELQERGETASLSGVYARMAARDARDSGRSHAPLLPAADAVVVDTTLLTREQSILQVVKLVQALRHETGR